MAEKLTDNKNIFLTTESERLAVTPHTQHLYKDADAGFLFYGDGSTVGGTSVDVRPATTKTTDYTLLRKDEGRLVVFNSGSSITLTIPTNANVPFVNGLTEIHVLNIGAGAVTLSGASGVTVSGTTSLTQYAKATIRKTGTDAWVVLASVATSTGDIEGVTAGTGLGGGGTSGTVTLTNTGVTSIVAGTNISISGATGAVTITSTDTNTQLTTEQVQDIVGDMLVGTETRIGVTYDDTNGRINFIVDDMTANTQLTTEEVQDIIGAMITGNTESGITVTYDDTNGKLDLSVASQTENSFTTTLKNKLDGIESSATADQTAAEIRALVEAATDSNVFTDADHSKLDAIEASATADQTAAEIRTLVESATDSNVFTDDDHTKLNSIEASATADQTAAEIRTLVESASDSNVFTDADHSKLDGIAASANNYAISSDLLDEDNMASNSATKVASQQSIKAYVDSEVAGVVDSAPAALNTLNELAAALGDDANYATTTSTALGNRLRTDTDSQGLTSTQQGNALTNLGITATKAEINILDDGLSASDIPSLAASKITSGTFATERIADNAITAGKLNVTGDGSATQFLRSDGDGSFTWAVPTDTDTNTQLTQEQVEDFVAGVITAGTNVSVTYDDAAGTLTIASTDTNTQLTTEEVQDIVGAMLVGTETRIGVTYDDINGRIDFVVDDMTANDNTQLTDEQVQDIVGAMFSSNTETRITATYDDINGKMNLVVDDQSSDNNTTYSISAVDGDNADEEKIRLTDSVGGTDDVVLEAGTGLSIARSGDKITFTNTVTDTNTQLTTEQVQDIIGAMVDGGTETNISVTYDDTNGKINFVSTDTNTEYSVGDGGLTQNNFTNTLKTKLDGIATSANNYVHPNHTGEVTSTADGATVIASNVVDEDNLKVTNSPTDNHLLSYDSASGGFTWVAAGAGGENNQNAFSTVAVSGQDDVVADAASDTLTFAAGSNVTITTTAGSDTITFASSDTNTQLTQEQVEDYVNGLIVGGTNVTATYDDAAGTLTLSSTDTNTQLSTEQVQDIVGAMLVGTETRIGVTYDDTNGRIDFVVDDMTANDNTFRTITAGGNTLGSTETLAFTAGSNVTITESGGAVTIASTDTNTNTQLSQEQVEDYIDGLLTAGSNVSLTYDDAAGTLTIASTDTNTQLSTEQVQDIVGAMFSSNTETRVAATYDDTNGKINVVVDDMTANDNTFRPVTAGGNTLGSSETLAFTAGSNVTISESGGAVTIASTDTNTTYSVGDGGLTQNNFTNTLKSKLDGIAASANNYAISSDLLDEDNMATNSATKVASQQSIKAYVDAEVAGIVDSAPAALDTLNELAAALGDDANFATTTSTALGNRLRVDVSNQGLNGTQQSNARTNLGLGSLATLSSVAFSNIAAAAVQLSSESFTDVDTTLMTSAAIQDKILSYGYTTNTGTTTADNTQTFTNKSGNISQWTNDSGYTTNVGDITAVVAGTGLSGGATSGSATINLSHLGIESLSDPNGDRLLIWDDSAGAIVFATPNSNLAISGTDVNATDTNTTYSVGDGGLTQNNFTNTLKTKLDGIAASANNYALTDDLASGEITQLQNIGATTISATQWGYLGAATGAITNTDTTYSAGTNISLSGTTFNVDDAFLINNGDDTTTGTITAGGFTTAGSITLGGHAVADIDIGSEFVDTDDHLMSSGAIKEYVDANAATADNTLTFTNKTFGPLSSGYVVMGASNDTLAITSNGAHNTHISTNSNTNSGNILIQQGANNPISITPNGTGDIQLNADTIRVGDSSADVTIAPNISGTTAKLQFQADGDTLLRAASGSGDMYLNANSLMSLQAATFRFGTNGGNPTITTLGTSDLTLNTNSGTNSGSIVIADGANNDITLTPNGTGDLVLDGLKWPQADGTANYVLKTDGSAQLSWTEMSSGASAIGGLDDVLMDATNFTDSILIQADSDGSAPTTGTLSSALGNTGYGASVFKHLTSGSLNTGIGYYSLRQLTTGTRNVGIGYEALGNTTTSKYNVAIGFASANGMWNAADGNVAIGYQSLAGNQSANDIVGIGRQAGYNHTSGAGAVYLGAYAGKNNTTGARNIAIGYQAYDNADTESDNIAIGYDALGGSVAGAEKNVVIGNYAGDAITSADNSVFVGYEAGSANQTGTTNTAVGYRSMLHGTGQQNVMIGGESGYGSSGSSTGSYNVMVGKEAGYAYTTASNLTLVGKGAGSSITTGSDNVALGRNSLYAVVGGVNNIGIGKSAGDNITSGNYNVVIGAADVPSATGNSQLSISSGNGGVTWITGDSNGGIASKAQVVAVTGNTTLTEAQSGSYVYWTAGTLTLPANATVGTQFTIFNNSGGSGTVGLGTNNSIVSGGASNAAVADNDSTSYICVSATNWWQVG